MDKQNKWTFRFCAFHLAGIQLTFADRFNLCVFGVITVNHSFIPHACRESLTMPLELSIKQ